MRDVSKVSITAGELREELPSASITVMELDLASLKSVRAFAKAFLATGKPLNILLQVCDELLKVKGQLDPSGGLHVPSMPFCSLTYSVAIH